MTNLVLDNPSIRMDVEFAKEIETWIANRWQIFQENQGMDPLEHEEEEEEEPDDEEEEDNEDGHSDGDWDDMEQEEIEMMGNN